mmetsp:Transcript_49530/g.111233  ORF Transcript_49530/g.111233 Transcript_49530/m.111233 type:complete len:478 (-) Transcript_49530:45-1478(-)
MQKAIWLREHGVDTTPLMTASSPTVAAPCESADVQIIGKRRACTDVPLFLFYGLLNNAVINIAFGAAQDIVTGFGYPDAAPLITTMSTTAAITGPTLLMCWPLNCIGFRSKALVATSLAMLGLLIMSVSAETLAAKDKKSPLGLTLALVAGLLLGLQQSLGENIANMRFQRCSKLAFSMWGAGTGVAGILPPLAYGLVSGWRLSLRFLVGVPLLCLYLVVCTRVYAASRREAVQTFIEDNVVVISDILEDREVQQLQRQRTGPLAATGQPEPVEDTASAGGASTLGFVCYAFYATFVFSGVYGLEYTIFPTLLDRSTKCPPTASVGKGAYNNSWIFYNVGVTLSRGSILLFEFPHLWLLIVAQAINVVLWAVEVHVHFIARMGARGYMLQYLWMTWVGLMGGAAYANCLRAFHCSPRIPTSKRDRCINVAFLTANVVILSSTLLGTLLDNTVLTEEIVVRGCPHVPNEALLGRVEWM